MGEDHLQEARRALGGAFYGENIYYLFDNNIILLDSPINFLSRQLVLGDILILLVK